MYFEYFKYRFHWNPNRITSNFSLEALKHEEGKLKPCDKNIKETFKLVDLMIDLANRGDEEREDVGCGIIYGILRDSAFKIKKLADQEKAAHIRKGWWVDKSGHQDHSSTDNFK